MRFLRTLALLGLAAAGCSQSHSADDAGPMDAPGCSPRPTNYVEVECPTPALGATSVTVEVTSAPTVCCGGGTVTPTVRRSGDEFSVELAWNACDCCEACRCIGPIEMTPVTLDGLEPGHSYRVTAGAGSCSFTVSPFTHCPPQSVAQVRMPRVVLNGDRLPITRLPITLQSVMTLGGCSCTRAFSAPVDTLEVGIVACECCVDCECVDPMYEVSGERDLPPLGDHDVGIISGMPSSRPLAVRDAASCRLAPDPLSLDVIGPSDVAITNGPAWWWVHAFGAELVCCVEPLPVLVALEGGPGNEYSFEVQTCTADPCDCVPKEPTRWETWALLGEIPTPGDYSVTVGTTSVDFVVP